MDTIFKVHLTNVNITKLYPYYLIENLNFSEKKVETLDLCIIVMHIVIFIKVDAT